MRPGRFGRPQIRPIVRGKFLLVVRFLVPNMPRLHPPAIPPEATNARSPHSSHHQKKVIPPTGVSIRLGVFQRACEELAVFGWRTYFFFRH